MTTNADDLIPTPGWVDSEVAAEFPGLRILQLIVGHSPAKRSPREVKARLNALSDAIGGARAVSMRQEPVPAAYRVFYRQIGMDPDQQRPPLEAAALDRLLEGRYKPHGSVQDALTIALVETGVPIYAFDAERIEGGTLGVRISEEGERLGGGELARQLPAGRLVIADGAGPVSLLFGDVDAARAPTEDTKLVHLLAVAVPGVPEIHLEESIWSCGASLITTSR